MKGELLCAGAARSFIQQLSARREGRTEEVGAALTQRFHANTQESPDACARMNVEVLSGWTRLCALLRRCSTPPGTARRLVSPSKVK